ncbi:MAG: nucleotidyltransferase family protein [Acidilobaceae archaeon]|nr:nucleotidyltransferase family protein [Acidilobaceae archaeon]MCX8165086.1 nucleotidyltransferase family protein [Acidilobaceae archaeon]MDW7974397.1 nucleotidyltransferase family protein [Sulfolobales archaeon]
MRTVGVVLAGGEGKRFRPLTYYIPKSMVPVGRSERPLLEYIVIWLHMAEIRDILVLVGYRWRQIVNYFGDGSRFGVNMKYLVDKAPYSSTGGALKRAIDEGLLSEPTLALIWYGDILAPVNIRELLSRHEEEGADATIVVSSGYRVPVGVVQMERDGSVKSVEEKPEVDMKVSIGVMAIEVKSATRIIKEYSLGHSFDITGDLVPAMIKAGMKVRAMVHPGPWYDVGSSERYEKLDHEHVEEMMGVSCEVPHYVHL